MITKLINQVRKWAPISASSVDVSKGLTISHMASHPPDARYPDATAITYDEQNFKVTVVYNDHSVYVWDVRDIKKVIL